MDVGQHVVTRVGERDHGRELTPIDRDGLGLGRAVKRHAFSMPHHRDHIALLSGGKPRARSTRASRG